MSTTETAIRMFDCVEQYATIRDDILAAIDGVLSSGSLVLGPRVADFEEHFSGFLG